MDLFFLLIIVIFVIGPLIDRAMKGGAGQRPPQQGQPLPGQRPPPRRVQQIPEMPAPQPMDEGERAGENATDILPADLWAILTGQRPSSPGPTPTGPAPTAERPAPERPAPERPAPERPAPQRQGRLTRTTDWERSKAASATPPPEKLRDDRAEADALILRRNQEEMERRALHRGPPEIVSLESPVPSQRTRHDAFHRKLEAKGGDDVAIVDKPAGPRLRMDLLDRSELQRAVLLQEILGEPKGLE